MREFQYLSCENVQLSWWDSKVKYHFLIRFTEMTGNSFLFMNWESSNCL